MQASILDLVFSYSINKIELIAYIAAFCVALYSSPKRFSIAISAGVMATGLALGDLFHGQLVGSLSVDKQIYYWYLAWALLSLLQAFCVVVVHWLLGVLFKPQVKLVFITMAVNALLNTLMFIDRNITGLNFSGRPNEYSADSWLLWDMYSIGINANLLFLALVLLSRGELKGKVVWMFLLYCCCFAALSL